MTRQLQGKSVQPPPTASFDEISATYHQQCPKAPRRVRRHRHPPTKRGGRLNPLLQVLRKLFLQAKKDRGEGESIPLAFAVDILAASICHERLETMAGDVLDALVRSLLGIDQFPVD